MMTTPAHRSAGGVSGSRSADRLPRTFWIGLAALVVYVLLAAGLSNLLVDLLQPDTPAAEFALSHFVALPILIVVGLLFARWSGWWNDIWTEPAPPDPATPRRRWLLAVPILMLINPIIGLVATPWSERTVD